MIRCCLNCGAENPAEPCESCGFASTLAEFIFRRRLLYSTAIFLLGSLTFLPAMNYYPPLEADGMMIFLGIVAAAALVLAVRLDRRARHTENVEVLRRIFRGLLPMPWLLSLLLVLNGRFDTAPPRLEVTRVVGKFTMPGLLHPRRLIVDSWRPGQRFERVPVDEGDFIRFRPGDSVEIRVQEGLVGIPWVYSVLRH
jgi:hypothetical protein